MAYTLPAYEPGTRGTVVVRRTLRRRLNTLSAP